LGAWGRLLDTKPSAATATRVLKALQRWQADPALAGVRGPEALAKLPAPERRPWQQLWDDIDATLARLVEKPATKKPVVK
jgi:hypothetical protein